MALLAFASAAPVPVSAQTPVRAGRVEVRPFANLGGQPADAWIGTGIAAVVEADLVVPAADTAASVRWLVGGAYRRSGDQIRITADLREISADRDAEVTSLEVEGLFADLFDLQDALAERLIDALEARLDPDGLVPATAAPVSGPTTALAGFALPTGAVIDGPSPPVPPEVLTRDEIGRVTMRAIRLNQALSLDGRLDERVYETVAPVTDFVQQEPDEGALATDQTEVWVLFDADTLYIAARCWSEEPDRIVANEMKRDATGMFGNEIFAVVLDTFYDRRNGFNFITNALGGLFDATITDERTPNLDWNTVWDVQTSRFEQGWTLEMAIPFKSLRYRSGPTQIWGINFQRRVASKNEASFLTPIPASLSFAGMFKLSSAATLVGLEVPSSGLRFEVKPYAISDVTTDLNKAPPLKNEFAGDFGFDAKFGVTQGVTADLTYNTDFAQVEADEQQVNLTRFSLFFPEKREFFLEGQGIFDFGGGSRPDPTTFYFRGERFSGEAPVLFFSRRIGLQDGRTVPILGGGRLTGKVGPYNIGLLDVQTDDEPVSGAVPTNFSVVRLKRDVLRRSAIGGMFTGRSVSTEGQGANSTFGVDGVFSFYDNLSFNTYLAKTETAGLSGDDLSYQTQLDYNGDTWGVRLDRLVVGTNFNPEVGFVRREDFRRSFGQFRYSPRPRSITSIRKFLWQGSFDYITDNAGLLETRLQQGLFGIEFENGDRFFAGATDSYEFLKEPFEIANDVTIPVGGYSFVNTRLVYALAQQRTFSGGLTFDRGGFFGGDKTSVGYINGRIGVTSQFSLEPSVSLNWINLPQGEFTTELISTRATYTITPRMFVAAFLQYNTDNDSLGTNIRLR